MADSVAVSAAPREVGRIRSLLQTRLGLPTAALVGVNALATLWAFSVPGGPSVGAFVILLLGWYALGGYWLLRLITALFAGGLRSIRTQWVWWTIPVVVVIVTAALLVMSVPLLARFNLSQKSMEGLAQDVIANPDTQRSDRVGLFPVSRIQRFEGGMRFLVKGAGFLDDSGFAYSPVGTPPNLSGEDSYYHLEGPWYLWEEGW